MFWNRRKSSTKRPEELRDRDNSGFLEQFSVDHDDAADLTPPPPFRKLSLHSSTPHNVQYLQLTDGFNIVLGADASVSEAPPGDDRGDARSAKSVRGWLRGDPHRQNEAGLLRGGPVLQCVDEAISVGDGHGTRTGVTASSFTVSGSPASPVRWGGTGALSLPPETSPPGTTCPRRNRSSSPHARTPRPPLQRSVTANSAAVAKPNTEASDGRMKGGTSNRGTRGRGQTRTDRWDREDFGRCRTEGDKHENWRVEGGRGAHVSDLLSGSQRDRDAPRAAGSSCLETTNSPRADVFVTVTSNPTAAASDVQEPNKAKGDGGSAASDVGRAAHFFDDKSHKVEESLSPSSRPATGTLISDSTAERQWGITGQEDTDIGQEDKSYGQEDIGQDNIRPAREDKGDYDLCIVTTTAEDAAAAGVYRANVTGGTESNQSVVSTNYRHARSGQEPEADEREQRPTDMFRSNRHVLGSRSDSVDQPAVYRKIEEPGAGVTQQPQPLPQESDAPSLQADDKPNSCEASPSQTGSTGSPCTLPVSHVPETNPDYRAGMSAEEVQTSPSATRPTPPPKPKHVSSSSSSRAYENWSVGSTVTSHANDTGDDEDDSGKVSPGGSLSVPSNQGSKDSGLGVDVHTPRVDAETVACDSGVVVTVTPEEGCSDAAVTTSCVEERHGLKVEGRTDSLRVEEDADEAGPVYDNLSSAANSPDSQHRHVSYGDVSSHDDDDTHGSSSGGEGGRESPRMSVDSSFDDGDEETHLDASPVDNNLKMRHLLVVGELETEKTYLAILELLLHYKRNLEASCKTSQPVVSEDDVTAIFSNLQEIRDIHKDFLDGLQNKVNHWGPEQTVGDVFTELVEMFAAFGQYAENYKKAVATIHRCAQDNHRFQDLAQQIVLTSTTREVTSLEDALFKPVQRLQRNTLVLYDLIKYTPANHADHDTLQKALRLSQQNLENFGATLMPRQKFQTEQRGDLKKTGFIVELVGGSRKLRFLFLFSKLLVCTKRQQPHRGGAATFDCKWFLPIRTLKLDAKSSYQDEAKLTKKDEVDDLRRKLRSIRAEMSKESKKEETRDKQRPVSSLMSSRVVEKLQKRASELETQLILTSSKLPFKVGGKGEEHHTLFVTTDYDREDWKDVFTSLQSPQDPGDGEAGGGVLSHFDVQEIVNSVRGFPEVHEVGSLGTGTDEDLIFGSLSVTVHKLTGLAERCDTYCVLEMDSYGHFYPKARTQVCRGTTEPSWNEDVELELEGSRTLRVLCYRQGPGKTASQLLGRGALEMTSVWMKGTFQEKIVKMDQYTLVLSIRYTAPDKTCRRSSTTRGSSTVFGVHLAAYATREGRTVPAIVTACVQEVEKRGMEETGIYRVSGVSSDVQRLKKQFDKNTKLGTSAVSEVDIHSVTGLLKLYLRELPDPVFTRDSYPEFLHALQLSDRSEREQRMLFLFYSLPDINYYTAVCLLEHLIRVSKHEAENKMGIHNLSTIFGPTLLAPAAGGGGSGATQGMLVQGAEHCMKQSQVLFFYLHLMVAGGSLRRSSAWK